MTDDKFGGSKSTTFALRVPEGDTLAREVCDTCGFINYVNPKIVAGAVVVHDERILLCRRAINPRYGFWTIPAGYMEQNETAEAAARREAHEEACADIELKALLAVYSIARISQVQLIYTARLKGGTFAAGPESLDVDLFRWDDVPWSDLAFPSVHWALNHYQSVRNQTIFPTFGNPPGETGDRMPSAVETRS